MKKSIKIIIITGVIVLFISLINSIYKFNFKYKNEENFSRKNCMIIRLEKIEEDKITYLVKYNNNNFLLNIYENEGINLKEVSNFTYGDIVSCRGKIVIPSKLNNPYEFDYKLYLNSNDIVGTISCYDIKKVGKKLGNLILKLGYFLRDNITYRIDSIYESDKLELLKTMIYGEDINLDKDIGEVFKNNGLSHVLAVSGMHMTYLLFLIDMLLKNKNSKLVLLLDVIILVIFTVISALSISVIRACIMSLLAIIEKNNKIKVNKYANIIIAFMLIIAINPYSIFSVSFLLSFLSTFGIILLYNLIYSYFKIKFKLNYITRYIFKTISLNISSIIMILPLQIYFTGSFELISILSNLIISPIISFEFIIGFLTLLLIFIPYVSNILVFSNLIILEIIIHILNFISKLNYFTIYIPRQSLFEIFTYYLLIAILSLKKYIPALFNKKRKKIIRNIAFLITIFVILYNISMYIYRMYFEEYVYFFNVGQGNMAIIREDRKVIIVDIGSTQESLAGNILNNFLKAKAINKIDAIFLTHLHDDHINGIYDTTKNIKINKVYYGIPKEGEDVLIDTLAKNNIPKENLNFLDEIKIGNVSINVLSPPKSKIIISNDIINSNSLVLLVKTKNNKILFMGDATIETEEELLKNNDIVKNIKDIDVIQIGHHGSKTSTSNNFISNINSCIAIISAKKEKFGHPDKEVLDILDKYSFKIKITQNDGAIKLK